MTSHYRRMAEAIQTLAAAPADAPPLAELAASAGLSPAHFQRLFTQHVGVSPKRFTQSLVLTDAEARLAAGADVLATATDAGLSGPGRLHDLTVSLRAMTPGELRRGGAGLTIDWTVGDTLLGPALVATTERGVCAMRFDEGPEWLQRRFPNATLRENADAGADALSVLRGASESTGPLALHVRGTPFQVQVWRALIAIPVAEHTSYGELAESIGHPSSARAVGNAVGANPIAVLIPCHRVLRKEGALGGYRWGLPRKRALLAMELS
ncbi:MAG: methylated-DNA--[protein]-cysteine S-methyltransferase [Deltaproteobacteria bacterium]|nr:methylated-DNA--[protein]-cysteine S-methyltransferase [Deltaproteobacteria bacterium]